MATVESVWLTSSNLLLLDTRFNVSNVICQLIFFWTLRTWVCDNFYACHLSVRLKKLKTTFSFSSKEPLGYVQQNLAKCAWFNEKSGSNI